MWYIPAESSKDAAITEEEYLDALDK
jgi:hypothetical protein